MVKNLLLLILGAIATSCYQPERKCQDYKNGTFSFNYAVSEETKTGTFTRLDGLSVEYYDGKIDSSSVRWINDCEFVVKKINPKNKSEEQSVHMKILSTTDKSYTFEYNIVGQSQKSKGTAVRLE